MAVEADSSPPRLWVVIPAAGHSRRMGRPKLLLPWGPGTILSRLLETFQRPEISGCYAVHRRNDAPLAAEVARCGATSVTPVVDPPAMRESVVAGLAAIAAAAAPQPRDGWFLTPADHPLVSPSTIEQLLTVWLQHGRQEGRIVLPTYQGRRGHPLLTNWEWTTRLEEIPPDKGLNWLLRNHPEQVLEVPVDDPGCVADLDTPDDYAAALRQAGLPGLDAWRPDLG